MMAGNRKRGDVVAGRTPCQSCGAPSDSPSGQVAKCRACRRGGASSLAEEAANLEIPAPGDKEKA